MPAATAAPRRQRAASAPDSGSANAPFIRWHWSLAATLLLIGAVAFTFLVPLRVCEPCRGLGTVTLLSRCGGCQGEGRQTAWHIFYASRQETKR